MKSIDANSRLIELASYQYILSNILLDVLEFVTPMNPMKSELNQHTEVLLESADCGVCGSQAYLPLYSAPLFSPYHDCEVVECTECSMVRTQPRPTLAQLELTYSSQYYSYTPPNPDSLGSRWKAFAMRQGNPRLYPYVIPVKLKGYEAICDIGCGAGSWLSCMRKAFPESKLYGFEIGDDAAQLASHAAQAEIKTGDLLHTGWPDNSFDYMTFWDVLEHVQEPIVVMNEVYRLLKPGGTVVIVSPDFDCLYSKIFKQYWWALLFDQHLHHFSKTSLSHLFQRANLSLSYHCIPPTLPHPHWNIDRYLLELADMGESNGLRYKALVSLMKLLTPIDKFQVSRLLPQHFMMCAQKPM